MNNNSEKNYVISIIIPILMAMTIGVGLLFMQEMRVLNSAYADLNQIEFISSSTQRLISLAQSNQLLQKDVFFIGDATDKALLVHGEDSLSILDDSSMILLASEVSSSWNLIENLIQEEPLDLSTITIARDAHFKAMTDLSNGINKYTEELNQRITAYQAVVMGLFFTIALLMLNNLLKTRTELKLSKELAEMAQIDVATGLYNRSRCQELFKNNKSATNKKLPAILVIDLNDLKKTNDTLGHRVGDELIQGFATALKTACSVHIVQPFIGRYGGDEFIVYYEDIGEEEDIQIYLKELKFLTERTNSNENRFQISYAVGYSMLTRDSDEKMSIRQLFDLADEAMYKNKVAMKREKNPDYDQQVANGEDVR